MHSNSLTAVSLFSGIGGFDLGLERAGIRVIAQVENDPNCRKLLEQRFPNADRSIVDVRDANRNTLPAADVFVGGFPCQDLSVAGKRAGLAGERSGLWFEFHRIIKGALPRWVIIENVPGLLSSNNGRDFAIILRGLVECGYGVAWRILDAQHFGVPQRRRRVFVVASLGDGSCAEVLFERESGAGDIAESGEERARVAAPLTRSTSSGRGVNPPGRRQEDDENLVAYKKRGGYGWSESEDVSPTLESEGGTHQGGPERVPYIAAPLKSEPPTRRNGGSDPIPGEFVIAVNAIPYMPHCHYKYEESEQANTLQDRQNRNNGSTSLVMAYTVHGEHSAAMEGNGNAAVAFETERARSLDSTGGYATNQGGTVVADAETFREQTDALFAAYGTKWNGNASADNGSLYAKSQYGVRRLTPTECEALQGFPRGWTDGFSDSVRYRMLGNAVAVPCAYWIAKRIPQ